MILETIVETWCIVKKRRSEKRQAQEYFQAARMFNDIHTHTSRDGLWMCPKCHTIHKALIEISVFTGLIYPACCGIEEGHRLYYDLHATTGRTHIP
jgi:hypothetical protein